MRKPYDVPNAAVIVVSAIWEWGSEPKRCAGDRAGVVAVCACEALWDRHDACRGYAGWKGA